MMRGEPKKSTSNQTLRLRSAGDTHVGGRPYNEDAVLMRPELGLFLVADGAGGHNAGNVASALATSSVASYFAEARRTGAGKPDFDLLGLPRAARWLSAAIHHANREIGLIQQVSERHQGMGSTIVAMLPRQEQRVIHLAHVGDSRCYRFRDGRLELLTHDHTLINDVLELSPELSDDQQAGLPRNVITAALGMSSKVRVSVRSRALAVGDRYLLCSDGLTRVVDDREICAVLQLNETPETMVQMLIEMAVRAKTADNIAVVVLFCDRSPDSVVPSRREPPKIRERPTLPPSIDNEPDIEILMLEPEPFDMPEDAADETPEISVVPAEDVSEKLLRAVHGVMVPMPPAARPALDTLPHTDIIVCPICNNVVELTSKWCPHCGEAVGKQ